MKKDLFGYNPGYIKSITVKGLKSIKKLESFELRKINVLIGANGAGKSNFIEAFNLIGRTIRHNLRHYEYNYSNSAGLFFGGPELTPEIELKIHCDEWNHSSKLELSQDSNIMAIEEKFAVGALPNNIDFERQGEDGHGANINPPIGNQSKTLTRRELVNQTWRHYELPARTKHPAVRRRSDIRYDDELSPDFRNLAPFLLGMKDNHPSNYRFFLEMVQMMLPVFDDFLFKFKRHGDGGITTDLAWRHKKFDFPMQHYHLSDGALRFIALAACLLQPNPPNAIIIDEPELGLHPEAIEMFADLVKNRMQKSQVIIATQSPTLVDMFSPEDIITVNDGEEGSEFKRLEAKGLSAWLEDYTLGQLWVKNVVEASP